MNPFKYLLKIHDALWADAFYHEKLVNKRESNWMRATCVNMSLVLSFNIITLLSVLNFFGVHITENFDNYVLSSIPNRRTATIIIGILEFLLPAFAFSYFTVFYTKRYKHILGSYKYKNGKLIKIYYFLTVFFFFGFIILRHFLTKD